jgi:hypothetical protein
VIHLSHGHGVDVIVTVIELLASNIVFLVVDSAERISSWKSLSAESQMTMRFVNMADIGYYVALHMKQIQFHLTLAGVVIPNQRKFASSR